MHADFDAASPAFELFALLEIYYLIPTNRLSL